MLDKARLKPTSLASCHGRGALASVYVRLRPLPQYFVRYEEVVDFKIYECSVEPGM